MQKAFFEVLGMELPSSCSAWSIVDPLLTMASCSAVTVVNAVAELDSPDVDGDTVFTVPESEDIFKTQKRICRWGKWFSTSTVYCCHFFLTALVRAVEKSMISLLHMTIPCGVRWALVGKHHLQHNNFEKFQQHAYGG